MKTIAISRLASTVEALESRIFPAVLVTMAYLNNRDGTFHSLADDAYKTAAYSFAEQDGYFAKYTEVLGNHFIVAAAQASCSIRFDYCKPCSSRMRARLKASRQSLFAASPYAFIATGAFPSFSASIASVRHPSAR